MLSKLVLMLGLLISGIIAYFCIDQNREKLTAPKKPTHTEPAVTASTQPQMLQESASSVQTSKTQKSEEAVVQPKTSPELTLLAPPDNASLQISDQSHAAQPTQAEPETAQKPQKIEVAPPSEAAPAKSTETAPTATQKQEVEDIQKKRIANAQQEIDTLLKRNPIYFEKGSNKITLNSKKILDKIIDIVNKTSEEIERMRIAGHTDASGSAAYNKHLSQKRAESVRDYLIAKKIKVPTLEAVGYGEEKPLTANPYAKENRRVEITIEKGE